MSARSKTATVCPARVSCWAAARPAGPGADDGDGLAGESLRRHGPDESAVERLLDRRHLDLLDGHGRLVDAEHAGRLARGGAESAGELREVVRRVQPLDGVGPVTAPGERVPLRDEVAERAALMAERDSAVHAPTGLSLELAELLLLVDLLPVADAHRDRTAGGELALASW